MARLPGEFYRTFYERGFDDALSGRGRSAGFAHNGSYGRGYAAGSMLDAKPNSYIKKAHLERTGHKYFAIDNIGKCEACASEQA